MQSCQMMALCALLADHQGEAELPASGGEPGGGAVHVPGEQVQGGDHQRAASRGHHLPIQVPLLLFHNWQHYLNQQLRTLAHGFKRHVQNGHIHWICRLHIRCTHDHLHQRAAKTFAMWFPTEGMHVMKGVHGYEGWCCNRCGPMVDLCHGPHLPNTGYLKTAAVNAFNRAFWRADVNKEPLQVLTKNLSAHISWTGTVVAQSGWSCRCRDTRSRTAKLF